VLALSTPISCASAELAPWLGPWYGEAHSSADLFGMFEDEDIQLVERMARGDTEALARLYDLHAPLLLALVRRIVARTEIAEDIVHDVFLEAWRRAADYDPERGSVRTWLALRARSRSLDYKKSSAVLKNVSLGEPRTLDSLLGSVDDATLAPDRARIRAALLDLPEEQHKVLLLGYFEGLSSSEIAERMGCPVGTVKSRVAAALGRLRAVLGDKGSRS
jgi:RNA polymerase sigma-70 factor (ECF subfamily)